MKASVLFSILLISFLSICRGENQAKHLFILSGQSNMQGHRPDEAFTPTVGKAFGKDNVIVLQDALGGQPIHRWWKKWRDPQGKKPEESGDLYDRLLSKVKLAIDGQKIASISFVWMQGERDAKMKWGVLYEKALVGLHTQLAEDLNWKVSDLAFVIGRLSDFDLKNKKYPHWSMVREAQVRVAKSTPKFAWVNTDDLNDGKNRKGREIKNDLHYSAEGYQILGQRFAEACIQQIEK